MMLTEVENLNYTLIPLVYLCDSMWCIGHWAGALIYFFFYLGFLSCTFMIHRTAGEGGGYLFNSSLPLLPASQTLRH